MNTEHLLCGRQRDVEMHKSQALPSVELRTQTSLQMMTTESGGCSGRKRRAGVWEGHLTHNVGVPGCVCIQLELLLLAMSQVSCYHTVSIRVSAHFAGEELTPRKVSTQLHTLKWRLDTHFYGSNSKICEVNY